MALNDIYVFLLKRVLASMRIWKRPCDMLSCIFIDLEKNNMKNDIMPVFQDWQLFADQCILIWVSHGGKAILLPGFAIHW